ncbi:MAG: ABC transporter ATP-binding protein [Pseudomonadota bacterium]
MTLILDDIQLSVDSELYLRDISVELHGGSFNVLLGRTRAGKTSLLRVIAGLEKPSAGRIKFNGEDITQHTVQQRNVAMVYQQFINYPHFTVGDNIASPLKQAGLDRKEMSSRVDAIATVLQIDGLLDRYPLELSGGQQQRTAMARALVKEADLILFDEPLANLDYKLREDLRGDIRELLKQRQTIAVYATTEPQEALALGGSTLLMHEGRIIQSGSSADVYLRPSSITAAALSAEPPRNIVPITITHESITLGQVEQPLVWSDASAHDIPPGNYLLVVPAHNLSMQRRSVDDLALPMNVELAEINGFETHVHLAANNVTMLAQLTGVHHFDLDQAVQVYLPLEHSLLFSVHGQLIGPAFTQAAGRNQ